jgi:hypothetical protein
VGDVVHRLRDERGVRDRGHARAPSREPILAALRAAISLDDPYGPPAGLPELVRVDRGKDSE